jgi:CheY-like chemotaxis protein
MDQDLVQFTVADTGIGIKQDDLKRLFQPFTQIDSGLNRQQEGTGLGLALIQKLTDLHGGSVQVESQVGAGSSFTINLPWGRHIMEGLEGIKISDAEAARIQDIKQSIKTRERRTILLAEDNLSNVLTVGEYLEDHGHEVLVAHDGQEAVYMAEKNDPDIILMDIQMPVMDGLESIRRLRADPRFATTPIIALTALAMPGDRERCIQAGANEYLSKPVSLKGLLKTIGKLLAQ